MNVTLGPIAPVIGALFGALITAAVTWLFVAKRQSIGFWITPTEDITSSLRAKYRNIVFKINNKEMLNLNKSKEIQVLKSFLLTLSFQESTQSILQTKL